MADWPVRLVILEYWRGGWRMWVAVGCPGAGDLHEPNHWLGDLIGAD